MGIWFNNYIRENSEYENERKRRLYEEMKFVLQQNNQKMLKVYENWCNNQLGTGRVSDLSSECGSIEFLIEIIFASTGIRCQERIKHLDITEDVKLIFEELKRNNCPIDDIEPECLL